MDDTSDTDIADIAACLSNCPTCRAAEVPMLFSSFVPILHRHVPSSHPFYLNHSLAHFFIRSPPEKIRRKMYGLCISRGSSQIWAVLLLLVVLLQQQRNGCHCHQFQVGDLDCWGLPPPSSSLLYTYWSLSHHFRLGDSLLFLYPPSQDSVIQVTERAFNSCSLEDPILRLHDGNSLFNVTAPGYYYFISGVPGRCDKHQRLSIAVPSANGTFFPPPSDVPAANDSAAPPGESYPIVFGPTPAEGSESLENGASAAAGSVAASVAALLLGFLLVEM